MRKIVRKLIPVWKVHEEEAWLNSMADAGWKLCHVRSQPSIAGFEDGESGASAK